MKTFGILLLFILAFYTGHSQADLNSEKKIPINLPGVLKLAGANNLTIKQYGLMFHLSVSEIQKADEWFLPTLFVGPELHFLHGANMNAPGILIPDANQKELWLEGGFGAEWDFNDGIYNVLAKKQQSLAVKEEGQAQRNKVILNAVGTYYDLLTAQFRYYQLLDLLAQADTIANQVKVQVDAGLRYQSEYLLAQTSYGHIQIELTNAQVQLMEMSNNLLDVLNIDTNALLISRDSGIVPLQLMQNIADTSMTSYNQYTQNRPEYKSMTAQLNAIQEEKKTTTVGMFMPKLYLGSMPDGVLGTFGSPYNSTYRVDGALLWDIPLGRIFYAGDLKMYNDKIAMQQNNLADFSNQVHNEVDNARAQIILTLQQIKTATTALQQSKLALHQSIEREKLGTVLPFEVFQSEEFYVQAELDYLTSVSNYNKAQYAMYVAVGNNL